MKTFYHYSDSGLVAEMDSNGNTLKSYGYRPNSLWGTDPLFMRENGKNYWYLNDHLGTPQIIVAENGGVVWKAQYQVFGKAEISNDSTVTNNLRFPGQYCDEETGLYYNWNRYYDPESGRYTQVDPIGFEGGEVNLYSYSKFNSINYFDVNGLCKWKGWMSLVGGGAKLFGISYVEFRLESECCDGVKIVDAVYRGVIAGVSLGVSFQAFQSEVIFEGPSRPKEKDGSGAVSFMSFAAAVGGGYGVGWIGIGDLAGPQQGLEVWLDGGVDLMPGYVFGKGRKVCCDK